MMCHPSPRHSSPSLPSPSPSSTVASPLCSSPTSPTYPSSRSSQSSRSSTSASAAAMTRARSLSSTSDGSTHAKKQGRIEKSRSQTAQIEQQQQQTSQSQKPTKGKRCQRFYCTGFSPCDLSFTRSEHLARHIRKHTGERPFQCHCSRRFSRLDNLRQHAQTVHVNEKIPSNSLAAPADQHSGPHARQLRGDRKTQQKRTATTTARGRLHNRITSESSFASASSCAENGQESMSDSVYPPPLVGGIPPQQPQQQSHQHLPHAGPWYSVQAPVYNGYPPMTPPPSSAESASFSTYAHPPSQVVDVDVGDGRRLSWPPPPINGAIQVPPYYATTIPPSVPSNQVMTAPGGLSRPVTSDSQHNRATRNGIAVATGGYPVMHSYNQPPCQHDYEAEQRQSNGLCGRGHARVASMPSALSFSDIKRPPQTSIGQQQQLPGIESFDNLRRPARSFMTNSAAGTVPPFGGSHRPSQGMLGPGESSSTQADKENIPQCMSDNVNGGEPGVEARGQASVPSNELCTLKMNGSDPNDGNMHFFVRYLQKQSISPLQSASLKNESNSAQLPIGTSFSIGPGQCREGGGSLPAAGAAGEGMDRLQALVAVATASSENDGP